MNPMKKRVPNQKVRNFDYPEETEGSRIAAENRKKANSLNQADRENLFEEGMRIIYGGSQPKQTVRSR